jgi:hypothetical protein
MQQSTAKFGQVCVWCSALSKLQDAGIICGFVNNLWLTFCEFRLQEKLTNLENENHVLRQKAFNMPPMNNLAVTPRTLPEVIFFVNNSQFMLLLLTPLLCNTIKIHLSCQQLSFFN